MKHNTMTLAAVLFITLFSLGAASSQAKETDCQACEPATEALIRFATILDMYDAQCFKTNSAPNIISLDQFYVEKLGVGVFAFINEARETDGPDFQVQAAKAYKEVATSAQCGSKRMTDFIKHTRQKHDEAKAHLLKSCSAQCEYVQWHKAKDDERRKQQQ